MHRDIAGYDMSYDEFKKLCRKSREDEHNYLCTDRSKKRDQGRFVFILKSKPRIQYVIPK